MKAYTRVLKGHIGLATATFPDGTPGFMIDAFARRHLWEAGLDYQHGTGHGVGASLNVHEGPHVRFTTVACVSAVCMLRFYVAAEIDVCCQCQELYFDKSLIVGGAQQN